MPARVPSPPSPASESQSDLRAPALRPLGSPPAQRRSDGKVVIEREEPWHSQLVVTPQPGLAGGSVLAVARGRAHHRWPAAVPRDIADRSCSRKARWWRARLEPETPAVYERRAAILRACQEQSSASAADAGGSAPSTPCRSGMDLAHRVGQLRPSSGRVDGSLLRDRARTPRTRCRYGQLEHLGPSPPPQSEIELCELSQGSPDRRHRSPGNSSAVRRVLDLTQPVDDPQSHQVRIRPQLKLLRRDTRTSTSFRAHQ